jgi:hypothetical protein
MPFTTKLEQALLGYALGGTNPSIPATYYVGLIAAASRANSTVVSSGAYVINPTFPFSYPSSLWSIFKCTTSGTTAGSAPAGFAAGGVAGGTITDGTAVWTEVSTLFAAGTFTSAEPSGGAYAREASTNNTTDWPAPSGGNPATSQNGVAITFPSTTGSWGQLAGFILLDALTGGNGWMWGVLSAASEVATVVGVAPQFAIDSLTITQA